MSCALLDEGTTDDGLQMYLDQRRLLSHGEIKARCTAERLGSQRFMDGLRGGNFWKEDIAALRSSAPQPKARSKTRPVT